ncbi:MAG: ATP-binding protein, partial [candidate division WOR-3 bacterium]
LIRPPGGRNAVNEQFEVTRKDGRRMSVAVNRALLRRGAKPEVLVVAHDITERRRQAEELARLREQLAALEAEVASTHKQLVGSRPGGPDLAAQVVARLEQQLKIPFGVIRNSAYMLELTLRSGNGPALGYVRELVSALDQASLALGEIPQRAAPQVARRSRVKVCELVRPCLQALPERVTVGYAIPEELPPVEVDVAQIQRVIQALVSNAVEAMPKGGQLELRAESQDGAVILEVRDTGSGMTREVQERVFQPFFSTKGRLGLGLFRIREVVEANQGRVEFVSDEGKGTTFRLWLPKAGVAEKTSGQGEMEKQEPP